MNFVQQLRAAQTPIEFSGFLYRGTSAQHHPACQFPAIRGNLRARVLVKAMLSAEDPAVVHGAGMLVLDTHRLPPKVAVYLDDDGVINLCDDHTVPAGCTLWHDFFTILRGPEFNVIVGSLVGDGQRFLATLSDEVIPEFVRNLESSRQAQNALVLTLYMRCMGEDFFQPAAEHLQALKAALLKMPKCTTQIEAYISFCDYFLCTLIRKPWNAMCAAVDAAKKGDWPAVARAARRWSPHPRVVSDLLQPVVESLWPMMVQCASAVIIAKSARLAVLGDHVDPDQFQQLMAHLLGRRLDAADGHRSQRVIRIDYDAAARRLCVSDNGYPINQPYTVYRLARQIRANGWSAQVKCKAGQNLIALTPPLPK